MHNKPLPPFIDIPIDPEFMQRVKNLCILPHVMDRGLLRFMPTGIFPEVRHLGTWPEGTSEEEQRRKGHLPEEWFVLHTLDLLTKQPLVRRLCRSSLQQVLFEVEEPGGEPMPGKVLYMQCRNSRHFGALTTPQVFYGLNRDLSGIEDLTTKKGCKVCLGRVLGSGNIWGSLGVYLGFVWGLSGELSGESLGFIWGSLGASLGSIWECLG